MSAVLPSRTLSISIRRAAEDVYRFTSKPSNFPLWSFMEEVTWDGDAWLVRSGSRHSSLRMVETNAFGIFDHYVLLAPDVEMYVPARVIPSADGCEVLVTLFQVDWMTPKDLDRDAETVLRDLERLKVLLEQHR